jgi:hypothetical protein
MKCGACVFYNYNGIGWGYECDVDQETVTDNHDCHCDAERVKRLLEQVPEVRDLILELLQEHVILNGSVIVTAQKCTHCGAEQGRDHTPDCLIARARALVGGGE